MKRVVSLKILIVFLLSLLYMLPAEAEFLDEQIHASLGFEEDIQGVTGVGSTATTISHVVGGANGTKGALKIHEKIATGDVKIDIPNVENLEGKKIKVSFWAKWDKDANAGIELKRLRPGAAMFFPHSGGTASVAGYDVSTYNNPTQFMQGEWTYIEFTIPAWSNLQNTDGSWNGKDGASNNENDRFDYDYVKSRGIYIYPRLFVCLFIYLFDGVCLFIYEERLSNPKIKPCHKHYYTTYL